MVHVNWSVHASTAKSAKNGVKVERGVGTPVNTWSQKAPLRSSLLLSLAACRLSPLAAVCHPAAV